jgi:hypothetical protein
MATRLRDYIKKATFTTSDLEGAGNGGMLSANQARQFLRDAIEATEILSRSDAFDSGSPKFEIPKISLGSRIMRKGTQATRVADEKRVKADTDLVTLSTELFKGEVPIGDEVFEDNVEREGLAQSLMQMIAEAVGRDLEEIAIKSNELSDDEDLATLEDGGIIQQLVDADENVVDVDADATIDTYRELFSAMIAALPTRYRRNWGRLVFYVNPAVADGYADELGDRATTLGDSNVTDKPVQRYRSIPVIEVPLMSGTDELDEGATTLDYAKYAILTDPKNIKTGFHRRVRVEKFRDPREGVTSFLPSVRFDVKWAQATAAVLAKDIPAALV